MTDHSFTVDQGQAAPRWDELEDQRPGGSTQLVVGADHPVSPQLADPLDSGTDEVFAQRHAERRRVLPVTGPVVAEVDPLERLAPGEEQVAGPAPSSQHQHQVAAGALDNPLEPVAGQQLVELRRNCAGLSEADLLDGHDKVLWSG